MCLKEVGNQGKWKRYIWEKIVGEKNMKEWVEDFLFFFEAMGGRGLGVL